MAQGEESVSPKISGSILRHKRQLARVEKLAVRSGYEPRKVWRPKLEALRKLTREIEGLPLNRRLTVAQLKVYARTVERLYRRQRRAETLAFEALHRLRQINYRMRLTMKLASHRDLDQLLAWLTARKGATACRRARPHRTVSSFGARARTTQPWDAKELKLGGGGPRRTVSQTPRMTCHICRHPARKILDAQLASGASATELSAEYGLPEDTLRCHRQEHVRGLCVVPANEGDFGELALKYAEASKLAQWAAAKHDSRTAIAAMQTASSIIETRARLLANRPGRNSRSSAIPGWESLRDAILGALEEHPEAQRRVLCALDKAEYEDTSTCGEPI